MVRAINIPGKALDTDLENQDTDRPKTLLMNPEKE